MEAKVLSTINDADLIADSAQFAAVEAYDHLALVGVIKSLASSELILVEVSSWDGKAIAVSKIQVSGFRMQDIDHSRYVLTDEATSYLAAGSPEAQVFNIVPAEGLPLTELKV